MNDAQKLKIAGAMEDVCELLGDISLELKGEILKKEVGNTLEPIKSEGQIYAEAVANSKQAEAISLRSSFQTITAQFSKRVAVLEKKLEAAEEANEFLSRRIETITEDRSRLLRSFAALEEKFGHTKRELAEANGRVEKSNKMRKQIAHAVGLSLQTISCISKKPSKAELLSWIAKVKQLLTDGLKASPVEEGRKK